MTQGPNCIQVADITIRKFTHAIVNADEVAFFVNTGQVVQTMGPGGTRSVLTSSPPGRAH